MRELSIGWKLESDKPVGDFKLPADALAQTFAVMGIRGAGKSSAVAVMVEEFYRSGLPWIVLDPVGIWWGVRSGKDGLPAGGLDAVVFGGEHGDLPLDIVGGQAVKSGGGQMIARTIINSNVCAVIDLSRESKKTWRKFITDFCRTLMELNPKDPRHIFIEEAAEFCPQRTKVAVTAECKEAVERLVRLGRNRGYGCTLVTQRPATVDKDILSQCENLLVMRTVGKHDRKALMEWLEPRFADRGIDEKKARTEGNALVNGLAGLESGVGYFWSPSWLRRFDKVRIRPRMTFHPGETRKVGQEVRDVVLCPAKEFIEKIRKELSRNATPVVAVPKTAPLVREPDPVVPQVADEISRLTLQMVMLTKERDEVATENETLKGKLAHKDRDLADLRRRLDGVRQHLKPEYDRLRQVFEEIPNGASASPNRSIYDPWLVRAGRAGCKRLLEILIERGQVTKHQLSTLAAVPMNSTFRSYMAWLKRNGLAQVEGDNVCLRAV